MTRAARIREYAQAHPEAKPLDIARHFAKAENARVSAFNVVAALEATTPRRGYRVSHKKRTYARHETTEQRRARWRRSNDARRARMMIAGMCMRGCGDKADPGSKQCAECKRLDREAYQERKSGKQVAA